MKRYTVGKISGQSGLAVQTIREYADRGMLETKKDADSRYRYFDANAVNQTSAIRRMRMMGFSLNEVETIMTSVTREQYEAMLLEQIARQEEELDYRRSMLTFLREHARDVSRYKKRLNQGELIMSPACYCLDYRKNGALLCEGEAARALLNEWMAQALFVRNYSPYPRALLEGGEGDHIIGFWLDERYQRFVTLGAPVYRREAHLCAKFVIQHDDRLHLLKDAAQSVTDFLTDNRLEISSEPYFVGEIPFFQGKSKIFYATLYVPVVSR